MVSASSKMTTTNDHEMDLVQLRELVADSLNYRNKSAEAAMNGDLVASMQLARSAAVHASEAIEIIDPNRNYDKRTIAQSLMEFGECSAYDATWLVARILRVAVIGEAHNG